jgi:hypothetical protein
MSRKASTSSTQTGRRPRKTSIEPPESAPFVEPPEEETPERTVLPARSIDEAVDPSEYYDDSDEGDEELRPLDFNN